MPSCYLQLCSSQLASQKSPAGLKNPTHHNTESAKHTTFFVRRFTRCNKSRVGPGGCGRLDDPSMWWAGGFEAPPGPSEACIDPFREAILPGEMSIFDVRTSSEMCFFDVNMSKKKIVRRSNGVQRGCQTSTGPDVEPPRAACNPACGIERVDVKL